MLGNIVAILDNTGAVVVKYKYDAWGNFKVLDASGVEITDTAHIGYKNPFRYRGYYFSDELGLYYLKSRFYDPEVGRFISADTVDYLAPDTINGLNLYAYCGNNPVMKVDPSGHFALLVLLGALVGGAIGMTVQDIYQLSSGGVEVSVDTQKNEVVIKDPHKVATPWVQYIYSFYLNHINSETRDIIKGTTQGVQGEWLAHNVGYSTAVTAKYVFSLLGKDTASIEGYMKAANPANIGGTVFDNSRDSYIGKGLMAFNGIIAPVSTLIDFFVWLFTK